MVVIVLPVASEEHDGVDVDLRLGWTAQQVRDAERPLLEAGEPLMALAAAGLAEEVLRVLAARHAPAGRVLVLAGSGSNGGDALLAAAELARRGSPVSVARLGRRVHESALRAAERAGARLLPLDASAGAVAAEAARSAIVLDGILGTGARGGLRSPARQVVARMLEQGVSGAVVAVDLPSGVDPDTGAVGGPSLRADVTVTFGAVKAGQLREPGRSRIGRLVLVDIGLGATLGDPVIRAG